VIVVQHRGPDLPELLPALVSSRTSLKVRIAATGDLLEPGTVYICPPGHHLTTEYSLRLVEGPKLEYVRPSADLALQSAARTHGPGVVAVILSGTGRDGAAGCEWVSSEGGTVLVQDPASSAYRGMPDAAIARGVVDEVLPIAQLAEVLLQRVSKVEPPVRRAATRVLLVDDHRLLLDGLKILLESEKDIEVVAEAVNGHEAVRLAWSLSPDVIVMDIAMPHLDGIEATRRIRMVNPATKIVALSASTDPGLAERAMKAGASGFLDKNAAFSVLARAIRTVASNRVFVSQRMPEGG
jgi:two-component system, chemotaxis family, protein-glutamate methylesterase/glutaminase